jgi:hypothetical protein
MAGRKSSPRPSLPADELALGRHLGTTFVQSGAAALDEMGRCLFPRSLAPPVSAPPTSGTCRSFERREQSKGSESEMFSQAPRALVSPACPPKARCSMRPTATRFWTSHPDSSPSPRPRQQGALPPLACSIRRSERRTFSRKALHHRSTRRGEARLTPPGVPPTLVGPAAATPKPVCTQQSTSLSRHRCPR